MTSLLTIQLIGRGDLRVVKLGRLTRIIEADIERFVANTVAARTGDTLDASSAMLVSPTVDLVGRQKGALPRRRHSAEISSTQPWLLEPDHREAKD